MQRTQDLAWVRHGASDLADQGAVKASLARERYSSEPRQLRPGHRIEVLRNGESAFPAMLEAIECASLFVHLESYIVEDDLVGQKFQRALIGRARAGVNVRVIFDGVGSFALPLSFAEALRDAGVEVLEFRPVGSWRFPVRRWMRRDHRKLLVVDGVVGFTGGINIGKDYLAKELGGGGWRDTHVRIEGPAVATMERTFRQIWLAESSRWYPAYAEYSLESVATANTCWARFLATCDGERRSTIRRHYLHAINEAIHSVDICSAYFVPEPGLRRALERAAQRGVRVRLVLPEYSDVRSVQLAGEHTYGRLLRAGVQIHLWQPSHMHAKTAVVDGVWCSIGSYNLDYVSWLHSLEDVLEVLAPPLAQVMGEMFEQDLKQCRQLELSSWKRRFWGRRLVSALWYRFRRWL